MPSNLRFQVDDTIAAVSSGVGPAVRAVVRVSGPGTWPILRTLLPPNAPPQPQHRGVYETHLVGVASLPPIPVLLLVFLHPRSYTGQDLVEMHMPGSPPLVQAVLAGLLARGARLALPGEFTLRAFLAGKMDLTRAEALLAVLYADRADTLREALEQFAGNLGTPLVRVKERLLDLLAEIEASLDFPEEDLLFSVREVLLAQCRQAREELGQILQRIEGRGVLRETFRVVLTGRPNAGKSSLFNALIGEPAAIVSPVPGTTRDYLTATRQYNGALIELIDTAGMEPVEAASDAAFSPLAVAAISAQAQTFRQQQVARASLVLYCVPADEPVHPEDVAMLEQLTPERTLLVWTKCDLATFDEAAQKLPARWAQFSSLCTSAVTGQGLAELRQRLAACARCQTATDPLAVSLGRCQHHVRCAAEALERAEWLLERQESPELLAIEVRTALDELGAVLGEVYTEDLLDRIFSRFCIGK
ncbi:tRNA modification GTPase MnmE [bacterium HR36]|nr:tRNA modification GTPase MnmE [bacterium HR36]